MIILEGRKNGPKLSLMLREERVGDLSIDWTLIMQWLSMDGFPKIRPPFCVTSFITT